MQKTNEWKKDKKEKDACFVKLRAALMGWLGALHVFYSLWCFFLFVSRIPVTKSSRDQKKRDCHTKAQTITNASTVSLSFFSYGCMPKHTHTHTRTHTHTSDLVSSVTTFSNFQAWTKTWKVSHIILYLRFNLL